MYSKICVDKSLEGEHMDIDKRLDIIIISLNSAWKIQEDIEKEYKDICVINIYDLLMQNYGMSCTKIFHKYTDERDYSNQRAIEAIAYLKNNMPPQIRDLREAFKRCLHNRDIIYV